MCLHLAGNQFSRLVSHVDLPAVAARSLCPPWECCGTLAPCERNGCRQHDPPRLLQVREALCELELPYRRIACGKGSKRRPALKQLAGSTQVPSHADYTLTTPGPYMDSALCLIALQEQSRWMWTQPCVARAALTVAMRCRTHLTAPPSLQR